MPRSDLPLSVGLALDRAAAATPAVNRAGVVTAQSDPRGARAFALRRFWAALADRDNNPVDICTVGTSFTEGQGSADTTKRWENLLLADLRARYQPAGVTGGEGYVAGHYLAPDLADRWVLAGGATVNNANGLGLRAISIGAAGAKGTLTFTGSAIDLFWSQSNSTGTMQVVIDGGAPDVINTNNATYTNGNKKRYGGLAANSSHTVEVSYVSGGACVFEGAMVYRGDETKGIRLWDGGHAGFKAGDFVNGAQHMEDVLGVIKPHLWIIELGANDTIPGMNVTVPTFLANVQLLLSKARAKIGTPAPSVVVVGVHPRADGTNTVARWNGYYNALQDAVVGDVAAGRTSTFWSLQDRFGTDTATNPLGLIDADLIHPTPKGHRYWADGLLNFLLP